jgi:hypothetical protein
VQFTSLGDATQLFGFATRCRRWLFDYDMLSVLESEPHQRAMHVWWRDDKHNIHLGLHDLSRIRNQPQAWTARFKL